MDSENLDEVAKKVTWRNQKNGKQKQIASCNSTPKVFLKNEVTPFSVFNITVALLCK